MPTTRYITIREFCDFHQAEERTIERLADVGLITLYEWQQQPSIREDEVESLETMLRLHTELGINPEGIDAIMHMRQRITEMQQRMYELESRVRRYEEQVFRRFSDADDWIE